jgi:hypothetical protein
MVWGEEEQVTTADIDFSKVTSVRHPEDIEGEDDEDTALLKEMFSVASAYLSSFKWCSRIEESYIGIGVGKVVAVFLFRLLPAQEGVDEWVWVVVGDIPPAYITNGTPNPACALDAYIYQMSRWVEAVKAGKSVDELIPVNVEPTMEWAELLERRLAFLDKEILAYYADDIEK